MKAKDLIKEIIEDLINKNSKQYAEIVALEKEVKGLVDMNMKLRSEINFRDNQIETLSSNN